MSEIRSTSIRRGKAARHLTLFARSKVSRDIARAYGSPPLPLLMDWRPSEPKFLTKDEAAYLNAWVNQRVRELQQ